MTKNTRFLYIQLQQHIKELQNLFSWSQYYKWRNQTDKYDHVQKVEIPQKQLEIDKLRAKIPSNHTAAAAITA